MQEPELRVLITTFPGTELAGSVVEQLVREGCIACGNVVPGVLSIYEWQGQLCRETEVLCILKTTVMGLPRAQERLLQLHPYDVPELLVLRPEEVGAAYGAWVVAAVRGP
jgi:periplasmic divalent cation tolerance protein